MGLVETHIQYYNYNICGQGRRDVCEVLCSDVNMGSGYNVHNYLKLKIKKFVNRS